MECIYLIVGPSGSGKTTVSNELFRRYGYKPVVSCTDRPPRYEGEEGHVFLTRVEFNALPKPLCAYTVFNGHQYGVTEAMIEDCDVYVIDPAGVRFMQNKYTGRKRLVCIGIMASQEELKRRMMERGDSEAKAEERLIHDENAFHNFREMCDAVVETDDKTLDEVVIAVHKLIVGFEYNTYMCRKEKENKSC